MDKRQFGQDLQDCETVAEMLQYLLDNFDLENARPGLVTKGILINGLGWAIDLIKPARK